MRPLHNLTVKGKAWVWGKKEQASFQAIKEAISSSPVLWHADPATPYYFETDTSRAVMGAVLSQRQEGRHHHSIAFMSKSFTRAETNYDTHNKELLAMIKALEEWQFLLEGTEIPIMVFTDHRNLEYWQSSQNFNR